MNKILQVLTMIIVMGLLLSPLSAASLNITSALEALIDTTITREDDNYSTPREIIIAPIFANQEVSNLTSEQRYRGIYNYTVEYLGFSDIPYHYLIDKTGSVFEGNQGGPERKVKVDGIGDDLILIGYMTDDSSNRFNYRAEENIINLLTKVANENNISPELISVVNVIFVKNEESKTVTIGTADLFGNWKTSLSSILDKVEDNFSPSEKTYSVNVKGVSAAADTVEAGQTVDLTIDISNTGNSGIYGASSSEFLISKVDPGESVFFLNNIWQSTTQIAPMAEDAVLKPKSDGQFTFQVKAPLFVGSVSEEFIIENIEGANVSSNTFKISLNVTSSDKQIVEILDTETGKLNVRTEPSSVAGTIGQVSPGQRFFKLEDAGNGWIKIQLNDGEEGWIAGWYTRAIN